MQKATFGAGCFWCTEAVFQRVKGVSNVVSGYTGGLINNPTYEDICSGMSGHAEAITMDFDPKEVSYTQLLEIFFKTHDPTTYNRQGNDIGTQYRSVIFYHSEEQKEQAETVLKKLDDAGIWPRPIVTQVDPAAIFYPAEQYHQDYYNTHTNQPYCQYIIVPKLQHLESLFADLVKEA